jgi:hypothetical protein
VLTAAYLLEVDRGPGVERTAQVSAADHAVARAILDKLHARADMIEAVCALIEHHPAAGGDASLEQRVLRDAALLADLEERQKKGRLDNGDLRQTVDACCTAAGRQQAEALFSR